VIKTASSSHRSSLQEASFRTYCLAVVSKASYSRMSLYWLNMPGDSDLSLPDITETLREVVCDPLQEELWICSPAERHAWTKKWSALGYRYFAEKQFAPGVTDNLAHTVGEALRLLNFPLPLKVASGTGYLFKEQDRCLRERTTEPREKGMSELAEALPDLVNGASFASPESIDEAARYKLFHPIIEKWLVHDLLSPEANSFFLFPDVALPDAPLVAPVSLELSDEQLLELSKERLLALTLPEMQTIRDYFRRPSVSAQRKSHELSSDPTDVELEVIAQTWSEHCKHKIFNATITYSDVSDVSKVEGASSSRTIKSLYKTFIQAPTKELASTRSDLLSVFKDNSGVIRWDDKNAVCFKVETHNSPSALEPYGGALTGILGVNRDILGTGLGAKPIFNTDVFCFAYPGADLAQRPKLLPAITILNGVRKGVEDGGNKSGIPTINGSIFFDPAYRAKPLVFCGTGGILPLTVQGEVAYEKHTQNGDVIVMAGGRVGKDGVHGATFSSESLHEGSPVSAVQIGDPFTQKRLLDFVIEARDLGLITGITDNGAGGLSSSIGEMAQLTNGATLVLDDVPTKYPGLADWEIVVSESQERMTLSVRNMAALSELAAKHNVEVTAVGHFDQSGYFKISRNDQVICLLDLEFLHDGCPTLELSAEWKAVERVEKQGPQPGDLATPLLQLLAHPNISSREEVIRQYDHEVQGLSVIKPLMGEHQNAPCDAAVITPTAGDRAGLVVSNGLAPRLSQIDTYLMAGCAVDEAVRNAVCVGADPKSLALLDNFCWPDPVAAAKNPDGAFKLAQLVRACMGLAEAVRAFSAPLVSGKDSMKNDFDDGVIRLSILPTLLVSGIGRVPDINFCLSMEFKNAGDLIYLLKAGNVGFAGSHYEELSGWTSSLLPSLNLEEAASLYDLLHTAIKQGLVQSAHDVSDGGLAVAIAESVIASRLGATLAISSLLNIEVFNCPTSQGTQGRSNGALANRLDAILFGEGPANIVVSISPGLKQEFEELMSGHSISLIGKVTATPSFSLSAVAVHDDGNILAHQVRAGSEAVGFEIDATRLAKAWATKLPFD